jgi:hypothetical protein
MSAAASVLLVLFAVGSTARQLSVDHTFGLATVTLWFFAVTMVTIVELKTRSNRNLFQDGEWSKPLVPLLGALLAFAQYYYPNLKASWGGGAPVAVTIGFTKDSAISPSKTRSVQLIEESDEGFYLVGPDESRAVYVPRNAVAFIYFSGKASESQLLRDTK